MLTPEGQERKATATQLMHEVEEVNQPMKIKFPYDISANGGIGVFGWLKNSIWNVNKLIVGLVGFDEPA